MPRYIDADALLQTIDPDAEPYNIALRVMVVQAPTADVAPVRRGEWVPVKDPYGRVYCYAHRDCGCEHNEQSSYCPNCGAKMEDKS